MTTAHPERAAVRAMYAGLGLGVVALIAPYLDHVTASVLADHIRAGYPGYSRARAGAAATTYVIYLSVIGALGIGCWLGAIRAVRAGRHWARAATTAAFAAGPASRCPTGTS